MDIEHLTKTQIVLLVLLVSFVTSMATGIVTVSLMDQAPQGMTYTINRIIEQSAEAVTGMVTEDIKETDQTQTISGTKTVADVVAEASPSLVRVYTQPVEGEGVYVGLGVVAFDTQTVVTTVSGIVSDATYSIQFSDSTRVSARVRLMDSVSGISVLALSLSEGGVSPLPIRLVTESNLRLGQALMLLGGKESVELATGLLTAIPEGGLLGTNITAGTRFVGGPALTSSGSCAGVVSVAEGAVSVVPFSHISALLEAPTAE